MNWATLNESSIILQINKFYLNYFLKKKKDNMIPERKIMFHEKLKLLWALDPHSVYSFAGFVIYL